MGTGTAQLVCYPRVVCYSRERVCYPRESSIPYRELGRRKELSGVEDAVGQGELVAGPRPAACRSSDVDGSPHAAEHAARSEVPNIRDRPACVAKNNLDSLRRGSVSRCDANSIANSSGDRWHRDGPNGWTFETSVWRRLGGTAVQRHHG